jgi:hypothetical protein
LSSSSVRWSGEGPAPLKPEGLDAKAPPLQAGSRQILLQAQQIDDVEIEGNFYKELSSTQTDFVVSKWSSEIPVSWRAQIISMKRQKPSVTKSFLLKNPNYEVRDLVSDPEIVILNEGPRWKWVFQTPVGELEALYTDRRYVISKRKRLGSEAISASATLFPSGPLMSQLENVLLTNLADNRTLTSPQIRVLTQSDSRAMSENAQFLFPLEDRRFEQVQTFFYLSKALDWTEKTFKFKLPFVLVAETAVGFPEKTNTAFYFQRKIRLGDGDDIVFAKMALDPSIVIHEAFHGVIDAVAKLPTEGEGGSLNEGFADFLTTSLLNHPHLGESSYKKAPYKRTVSNNRALNEKTGGLYFDSGIISGTFWSLRTAIGPEAALIVAWETLLRMAPNSDFTSFQRELIEVTSQLPIEAQGKAREVLKERGWLQ